MKRLLLAWLPLLALCSSRSKNICLPGAPQFNDMNEQHERAPDQKPGLLGLGVFAAYRLRNAR
jgi:hypothetical protein